MINRKKEVSKITHDYKCDFCDKPAEYNVQEIITQYEITPEGEFEESQSWDGGFNEFLCEEHYEEYYD